MQVEVFKHAGDPLPHLPNLVKELGITCPDQLWVSDITCIRLHNEHYVRCNDLLGGAANGLVWLASSECFSRSTLCTRLVIDDYDFTVALAAGGDPYSFLDILHLVGRVNRCGKLAGGD